MTFAVEVNGRIRTVAIERTPREGQFRVSVDGHVHLIEAARVGASGLSLIVPEKGRASHDVEVLEGPATGEMTVRVGHDSFRAVVNGRRAVRADAGEHGVSGEQRIVSPMPGRVLRVMAAEGDQIGAGQPLIVVEAMKMENEFRSPKSGRVKHIGVREGMAVEAGRLLAIVE